MSDTITRTTKLHLTAAMLLLMACGQTQGQDEKVPHRPVCTSTRCRRIKSFLKAHYCGESPAGNGPDDGCEIRPPKKPAAKVTADFACDWSDGKRKCQQHDEPPSDVRNILLGELRQLGLPPKATGQIYFRVWESPDAGWSLAEADYDHLAGENLTLCHVIVIIDQSTRVHVLRKVRFQKTDADKSLVTTWSPIDLADINGDGQLDVILEGDAYENHWFEVDTVNEGTSHTVFSGLGYYL